MVQSKNRNTESVEKVNELKRKETKKQVTPVSQFKNYIPGTPFGIRKNREKIIKKI